MINQIIDLDKVNEENNRFLLNKTIEFINFKEKYLKSYINDIYNFINLYTNSTKQSNLLLLSNLEKTCTISEFYLYKQLFIEDEIDIIDLLIMISSRLFINCYNEITESKFDKNIIKKYHYAFSTVYFNIINYFKFNNIEFNYSNIKTNIKKLPYKEFVNFHRFNIYISEKINLGKKYSNYNHLNITLLKLKNIVDELEHIKYLQIANTFQIQLSYLLTIYESIIKFLHLFV